MLLCVCSSFSTYTSVTQRKTEQTEAGGKSHLCVGGRVYHRVSGRWVGGVG